MAIVRNKFLAVLLGPSGVGLFAQLFGFQTLAAGLVPMGMQVGALRYIAKYLHEDDRQLTRFVHTAARMFLWLSIVTAAICLLFIKPVSEWALDSVDWYLFLLAPILGIPFIVQSQMWLTVVQAGLDIKAYSKALVITSVLGVVAVVPLVLAWGQGGASVHLLVFPILGYAVARWYANRAMSPALRQSLGNASFDFSAARSLVYFAVANLPTFGLTLFLPFLIRSQIIRDVGLDANGIYQAVFAISSQFLAIPIGAMGSYSFPKISKLESWPDINREVTDTVRAVVLFTTFGILALLIGRDLVIRVLFSGKFLGAAVLFPAQMLGDFFKIVTWAIQLPMLPLGRFRARTVLAAIQFVVAIGVFYSFPAHLRLEAAVVSHLAAWFTHYVTYDLYLRKTFGFRYGRRNAWLLVSSCAAISVVAFFPFPGPIARIASIAVAIAWAATAISRREITGALEVVRARMGKP